ncbi:MAG: hypothetical protein AB1405_00420 [Bdellovibrionota bacterium]
MKKHETATWRFTNWFPGSWAFLWLLAGFAIACFPRDAGAQAEVPFYASTEVEPNIFFVIDTSGSMNWDFQVMDGQMRTRLKAAKKILTGRYGTGSQSQSCPAGYSNFDPPGECRGCAAGYTYTSPPTPAECRACPSTYSYNASLGLCEKTSSCPGGSAGGLCFGTLKCGPNSSCTSSYCTSNNWIYYRPGNNSTRRCYDRITTAPLSQPYLVQPYLPSDSTDSLDGIIDVFGSLVNFAVGVYSGSPNSGTSALNFPNGQGTTTFSNDDNPGLESTILAQSANGGTPTGQAMRDAGCWIIGSSAMNSALADVASIPEDSDIPLIAGQVRASYSNLCLNQFSAPAIKPCPGNAGCDPSFACRRTFIILLTDGEETSGWGCAGVCPTGNLPGPGVPRDVTEQHLRRQAIASAIRRSQYLASDFTEPEKVDFRGIPTFVALFAPCDPAETNSNSSSYCYGGPDVEPNRLVFEGNQWGRYGGTDATPDATDDCKPNGDGGEAYLGTDADALREGLRRAVGCAIEGSHTRAEPAFVATSSNFSENLEIDGYFEVVPGEIWWRGHLQGFTFEAINDAAGSGTIPQDVFDAGEILTAKTGGRRLYVALDEPFQAPPVDANDPSKGAILDPPPIPPSPVLGVKDFTISAAGNDISSITSIPVSTSSTTDFDITRLIQFIRDEDGTAETITFSNGSPKKWSLGPIVNSTPAIMEPPFFDFRVGAGDKYFDFINQRAADPDVIFVGAQDGFMHAFYLSDPEGAPEQGDEIWGFMPYEAILRIPSLPSGVVFTVDGSPTAQTVYFRDSDSFETVLIFGQRSGGFSYVALKITDPTQPELLWQVTHPAMGRTFSKPNLGTYRIFWDGADPATRWLMATGAGFNGTRSDGDPIAVNPAACFDYIDLDGNGELECVDSSGNEILPATDTVGDDSGQPGIGNWILFYDVETGRLVQNVKLFDDPNGDPNNPDDIRHKHNSVPGDLLALDRGTDGTIDNVIFGDMEGRLWKILTYSPDVNDWRTNAEGNPVQGAGDDGGKPASPCLLFDPAVAFVDQGGETFRRPISYAPAATFDCNGFVNLIWGTGDLTDPNNTTSQDYLFAINDPDASSCGFTDPDDVARDFTCDEMKNSTDSSFRALGEAIDDKFPFALPEQGEKILSTPLIINGRFFVTTYRPGAAGCSNGSSRFIAGPAVCCGLVPEPGQSSFDVLEIVEGDKPSPPLILGPDGRPMTVRATSKDGNESFGTGKISEIARDRRILHWVDVFGVGELQGTN